MSHSGKTVYVGLSGGVDSSVAALLLQQQGYQVVGVYMKSWDGLPTEKGIMFRDQCTWKGDRRDAMRVAAKLKIPFRTYDFTELYRQQVIEYFFHEYEAGRTPNPDVMCNREIKFKAFLERAIADGADYIATGHYVRRVPHGGGVQLASAKDQSKDQSYFLWTLSQPQLERSLFPLGELLKTEVRTIAKTHGLATAEKKDSQGICFIGKIPIDEFLRARIPERVGVVQTSAGKVVGTHRGVSFYTIGQRHGLEIPSRLPYYVAAKDIAQNVVIVAEGRADEALYQQTVGITHCSWAAQSPQVGQTYVGRIRYRQPSQPLLLERIEGEVYTFRFTTPQRAVTSGQSLVLYDGDLMVGGGVIV